MAQGKVMTQALTKSTFSGSNLSQSNFSDVGGQKDDLEPFTRVTITTEMNNKMGIPT